MQWTFENFLLDTDNAALWKGEEQVALRPKTFDVLRHLVEHAGDLVRKETLLETVWENSYVVEGVLTTSMSELRKIFGDTAKNQRFIATVYRRGYRFIAPVEQVGKAPLPSDDKPALSASFDAAMTRSSATVRKFPRMRGFVGREQECERLVGLLAQNADCRILTLVGAGGIGKTRLALTVVKMLSELDEHPFNDGFYAVPLQSLDSSDNVFSVIAETLELQYSGDGSLQQQIQNYLENKHLLLLLDNFEHLLPQAGALAEVVSTASGVKLLVTSRESLAIADAWFHPVSGLDYDDSVDADAVRLFAQMAYRNQPEFDLQRELPAVLRICRLVEGMPLALELAASWLKMLSMDEIADEIEEGIDILSDQRGGQDSRHSSVRAIFIETWQRLTESERTLLGQFSVFRGGADRAAISEIIGAGLPLLAQLVNKALLRTTPQRRYRMHELIRQFAAQALAQDAGSEQQAQQHHADYYIGWLGEQFERLRSSEQGDACREIQANIDNIRLAWRWAVAHQQIDLLRRAIRALSLFADLRGHFQDGLAMFDQARQMIAASQHAERDELVAHIKLRCAILNFRLSRYDTALQLFVGVLHGSQSGYERALTLRYLGDYQFSHAGHCSAGQAREYLLECVGLCEQLGDSQLQTECLCELSILYANLDIEIEASQRYAEQAVGLARRTGRPDLLAVALDVLAWTTNHRGDYAGAEVIWHEVFDIAQNSGNRGNEALATNWLGWSAWSVGGARHAEAAQYFSDALARYQDLGDRANQSMTHADLASVLLEIGDVGVALEHCQRGLELAQQIGRDDHYVYNLYTMGAAECAQGNLQSARELLTRALAMAWEQEEETNKPVVLYYIARLFYAEYAEDTDSVKLLAIVRLLMFLQYYPATWQTFRDRAARLLESVEADTGIDALKALKDDSEEGIIEAVLNSIPTLMH
jgi:DNA-binding winged helix-turn-helix (wHTH) protein/predicted ATPase